MEGQIPSGYYMSIRNVFCSVVCLNDIFNSFLSLFVGLHEEIADS